jgi:hypothetical protein
MTVPVCSSYKEGNQYDFDFDPTECNSHSYVRQVRWRRILFGPAVAQEPQEALEG